MEERILDSENKPKVKNSWKPMLILNGIVLSILLYFCYQLFISGNDIVYRTQSIIMNSLMVISVWIVIVNVLFMLVSLFFSKTSWKKWLFVIVCGVILFILTLVIQLIIDFDKILS